MTKIGKGWWKYTVIRFLRFTYYLNEEFDRDLCYKTE